MNAIPLPNPHDPLTAPHWRAAREGRIAMQRCPSCGYIRWPAANSCPECLAEGGEWTALSGKGTIWSFAVYEKPLDPAFAELCPYAVALVRLDDATLLQERASESSGGSLAAPSPAPTPSVAPEVATSAASAPSRSTARFGTFPSPFSRRS